MLESTEKFLAVCCGRRSGKTVGLIYLMLITCLLNPGKQVFYVTLSRSKAKSLVWDHPETGLVSMNKKHALGGVLNAQELSFTFPNAAKIRLWGIDDMPQAEKLRGEDPLLVIIDETQSFRLDLLERMIEHSIVPSLMDHDGRLLIAGTPGLLLTGRWFDAACSKTSSAAWERHAWTIHQNSELPDIKKRLKDGRATSVEEAADQILDEVRKRNGWTVDNMVYRREFLNEWITDDDALLYRYNPDKHDVDDPNLDISGWRHVLGVDIGSNDDTAYVVWAYHPHFRTAYQVYEDKRPKLGTSQIMEGIVSLSETFHPERIAIDYSTGGANYIIDLQQRFGLPVEAAEKTKKALFIDLMNSELTDGKLKVLPIERDAKDDTVSSGKLAYEWTQIERDKRTGKERPGSIDHLSDAALYAWRLIPHLRGEAVKDEGMPEWADQMLRDKLRNMKKRASQKWWAPRN